MNSTNALSQMHGGFVSMLFFHAARLQTLLTPLFLLVIVAAAQHTFAAPSPLITSSVKLRVDTAGGHSWGTGTIIDARQGEALILTCGHIFRGWQEGKNIEVHFFGDSSSVRVLGKCLFYDLEIDLALVAVSTPGPVRAVPIAPEGYQILPGQQTWSVGCDNGSNPTVRTHQVMSTDRISTPLNNRVPFHYIQVSGAPVSGRSGGGLFSASGYLIGVCNTACPTVNDGHFVPPHMIRHILDERGLAFVHQNPSLGGIAQVEVAQQAPPPTANLTALTPLAPLAPVEAPPMAMVATPAQMLADNHGGITAVEQATLEEINRRKQDGDEVIIIVRSTRNPETPSDVIVLNGPSRQFMDALVNNQPVNNPSQPSNPGYNPVIFSSHDMPPRSAERQSVSFPVRH
jgi:hypothetical protein